MVMKKRVTAGKRISASRMPAWLCRPFNELGRSTNSSSQDKNTFCRHRLISTTNVIGTQGPGYRTIRELWSVFHWFNPAVFVPSTATQSKQGPAVISIVAFVE
ncbi:hypothetical protein BDV33DRAFT_164184 [Aspergillus novoparasiticus]|uniref:Uncharacterized protein n=1 Tax=Aspergillus novoparasiticus TaxID=986946 RepID=A0A5N6F658_9EURO|nr:hypothetical protein BDV33DRAFT_164184 [Aspergillus novoparasiticus]